MVDGLFTKRALLLDYNTIVLMHFTNDTKGLIVGLLMKGALLGSVLLMKGALLGSVRIPGHFTEY